MTRRSDLSTSLSADERAGESSRGARGVGGPSSWEPLGAADLRRRHIPGDKLRQAAKQHTPRPSATSGPGPSGSEPAPRATSFVEECLIIITCPAN